MPLDFMVIATVLPTLVSIGNLCAMIYAMGKFLHKPTETQNDRLDAHDRRFDELDKRINIIENRLQKGSNHFNALDEGNSVVQGSLLAIMSALEPLTTDPEAKAEIREQKNKLYSYLTTTKKE